MPACALCGGSIWQLMTLKLIAETLFSLMDNTHDVHPQQQPITVVYQH